MNRWGGYVTPIFGKLQEFTRDITGLGNPAVLGILGYLVFGWTSNFFTLVLLWIGNEIFGSLIKLYFFKPRPEPMRYHNWLTKIEAGSFPSIHASRWACFATFSLLQSPSQSIGLALIVLAILVGWTRVVLKKHYWIDVVSGWALGFVFGWVIGNSI